MGNNHSKIKLECFLTMEERKIVTNFKAIRPKVYRNTTTRRQYANVGVVQSTPGKVKLIDY